MTLTPVAIDSPWRPRVFAETRQAPFSFPQRLLGTRSRPAQSRSLRLAQSRNEGHHAFAHRRQFVFGPADQTDLWKVFRAALPRLVPFRLEGPSGATGGRLSILRGQNRDRRDRRLRRRLVRTARHATPCEALLIPARSDRENRDEQHRSGRPHVHASISISSDELRDRLATLPPSAGPPRPSPARGKMIVAARSR